MRTGVLDLAVEAGALRVQRDTCDLRSRGQHSAIFQRRVAMVPPPFWHHLLADQVVQSGVSFGQSVLSISVGKHF